MRLQLEDRHPKLSPRKDAGGWWGSEKKETGETEHAQNYDSVPLLCLNARTWGSGERWQRRNMPRVIMTMCLRDVTVRGLSPRGTGRLIGPPLL